MISASSSSSDESDDNAMPRRCVHWPEDGDVTAVWTFKRQPKPSHKELKRMHRAEAKAKEERLKLEAELGLLSTPPMEPLSPSSPLSPLSPLSPVTTDAH